VPVVVVRVVPLGWGLALELAAGVPPQPAAAPGAVPARAAAEPEPLRLADPQGLELPG
jgi:hypothetical protein